MNRTRIIPMALVLASLTAAAVAAPPPAIDKTPDDAPALKDLKGIQRLAYSPDGKSLMALYNVPPDQRTDLWSYARITISPNGKTFVGTAYYNNVNSPNALEMFDTEGKILLSIRPPGMATDMVFSPDGKTAVLIRGNDPLKFIDPTTGNDKEP